MSSGNLVCIASVLFSFVAQSCLAKDPPLMSLSMQHFHDTATVKDDPIAGVTTVATEKGYVEHHGPLSAVWNDEYLSGTIDRESGRRSFEVIATVTYRGTRRLYGSARFQGANGPAAVPTVPLKTSALNCPTGECTYTDRVSFAVEEGLLRTLAARSATAQPQMWRFTLVAKSSGDYSGELSSAEIAGFLARFDEYTGAAQPPAARPAASAKAEFGIGGLHVEASEQQPGRSGVLVTAVSRGSIADKAGVIVGDIVTDIDGHQIKTPPDIPAAIGASTPNASIAITVYRGTAQIRLMGQ